jgi:hypothetical protein
MKKNVIIYLLMLLSTFNMQHVAFANASTKLVPSGSITLAKYYRATCDDYTGEWQGMMTDPQNLFTQGNPWPITIYIHQQAKYLTAKNLPVKDRKGNIVFNSQAIYARCEQGVLKDIFWDNNRHCGSLSQQGLLVSQGVLVMILNWENAMTGTQLIVLLEKKSADIPNSLKKQNPERQFKLNAIKTCH